MKSATVWLLLTVIALALCGCAEPDARMDGDDGIKARLLVEAMDYVGACSAEQAVDVWAQGLMKRSAALQYAVMDGPLRSEYAKSLEKTAPNWVTGVSSPWVCGYAVGQVSETEQGQQVYTISVMTKTSAGTAEEFLAVLAVRREGEFWRIGGICADDGLSAYTGFQ